MSWLWLDTGSGSEVVVIDLIGYVADVVAGEVRSLAVEEIVEIVESFD